MVLGLDFLAKWCYFTALLKAGESGKYDFILGKSN